MLTRPRVFFLDEPTSGLDPATGAELLRVLRRLTESGTTIVLTTHAVQDLDHCDRVVFLASGGRLSFVGTTTEACRHFGVSSVGDVYGELDRSAAAPASSLERPPPPKAKEKAETAGGAQPRFLRQWMVLTARTSETLARNPLTLGILIGAPLMIVAMFAVLFRSGAFDRSDPDPTSILMILFWITFGSFFFGLTYGLLQIVTERAILRREYLVGLRLGPYLLSKMTVLLPFLVTVNVLMLVILRALDRLPDVAPFTYLSVGVSLTLVAASALALGLLASASGSEPSQATLALPLLCFPAVLFSGAILPVHVMATVGRWMSAIVPVRWGFEAVGRDLGVRELLLEGASPLGPPLVESYGRAGLESSATYWAYLLGFTLVFYVGAWLVTSRRLRRSSR
jgi:energy-coupling factor transporter ATP-binding protein EcfA2